MYYTLPGLGRFSTPAWFMLVQLEVGPQDAARLWVAIERENDLFPERSM